MVNFHSSRLIFLKFQVLKCILGVLASKDFHEISQICSADEYLSSTMHIFSSELYLDAIFCKKLPFLAKKSASNFFGPQLGKTKLIFLFYTFFRTSMQKIGDGFFFFFFSKGFGLADIWPPWFICRSFFFVSCKVQWGLCKNSPNWRRNFKSFEKKK